MPLEGMWGFLRAKPKKEEKREEKKEPEVTFVDLRQQDYVYIGNKRIHRSKIVSIDPENRLVVYIDDDGRLKTAELPH